MNRCGSDSGIFGKADGRVARDGNLACVRHERLQMDPIPHSRSVTSIYLYIILSVR